MNLVVFIIAGADQISSMMINDKFSGTYAAMTKPRLILLHTGATYYRMNYGKTRRAELSIGTGELHFKKLKVLTNQEKYCHLTSGAMVRCY